MDYRNVFTYPDNFSTTLHGKRKCAGWQHHTY